MNKTKFITLAMVLAMIVSAFGMMMPAANAEIVDKYNDRGLEISSTTLNNYEPDNFGDEFWQKPIYPGTQNVNFNINVYNDGGDAMTDDNPVRWANLSANTLLRNEAGTLLTTTTNPVTWAQQRVDAEETIWEWSSEPFNGFEFDVKSNAVPGIYNLTVILDYEDDVSSSFYSDIVGFIRFEIRERVEVPDIGNLKPGDLNVQINPWIHFQNNMGEDIEDVSISITLPDTDFWWFGESGATITRTDDGPFDGGDNWNIPLRLSVSASKSNGDFIGHYTVTYTTLINNIACTETGTLEFQVGNLPMLDVSVGTSTIAQGATKATWALTFTNVGTVDLVDVEFRLDYMSDYFTLTPADHWEDGATVYDSLVKLGDVAVDGTATQTMEVGINPYIPVGMHKIMFYFQGWYYDPVTTNYEWVEVDWAGTPPTPAWPRIDGTPLYPESSQVKGPYIDITVTDTVMDVMVSSAVFATTPSAAGRILDFPLVLNVLNQGYISYSNMVLRIETNTAASPFTNVVSPAATLSEEASLGFLGDGADEDVTVRVSLKPDAELGVYMVPVTINAVNFDMGESITTVVNARITIRGVGPQIEVTSITPEKIKPGAAFTLTLVLTNVGDDTARNLILNSIPNPLENDETTINGNYAVPEANALPLYLDDIAPGATLTVEIPMQSNSDMSDGHVYGMEFSLYYVDSLGYEPSTDSIAVSVKSSGNGGSVMATFYWTMVILAFVIAIFLIIVAVFHVKKNKKPKVQPQEVYQQPPPPPMNQ